MISSTIFCFVSLVWDDVFIYHYAPEDCLFVKLLLFYSGKRQTILLVMGRAPTEERLYRWGLTLYTLLLFKTGLSEVILLLNGRAPTVRVNAVHQLKLSNPQRFEASFIQFKCTRYSRDNLTLSMRMDVQCFNSISESSSRYYETKTSQLTYTAEVNWKMLLNWIKLASNPCGLDNSTDRAVDRYPEGTKLLISTSAWCDWLRLNLTLVSSS